MDHTTFIVGGKRSEFHEDRPGLVTGSKCSVLFPLKGDGAKGQRTYAKQLAQEKFFGFSDEVSTWQTEHGKMGEMAAFEHYVERINPELTVGGWRRKDDCGGTTDAELPDTVIDFKCPTSLKEWLEYLYEDLDKEKQDQLQMYCFLTGKPYGEIAAYLIETQRMTDNGLTYPIPEEKRMICVRIEASKEWQEILLDRVPGVIKMRDEFIEKLKQRFNGNQRKSNSGIGHSHRNG